MNHIFSSVHLLPPVAVHSVVFSFGAFIKASLEIHALITSPSYGFGIAMWSLVLQKQQIKNFKHPSTFLLIAKCSTHLHRNLSVLDLEDFYFLSLSCS